VTPPAPKRAATSLRAALLGVCLSALSCAGAHAQSLSPATALALPSTSVSVPSVGVSLPSVGASLPSVGASVPEVHVSVPEVSVSTPGVTVSTPAVSVSTPTVTVSGPGTTSEPGTPKTPVTTESPSPPARGGAPTSPSHPPSSTSSSGSTGTSAPGAAVAQTSSDPSGAPAGGRPSPGAGHEPLDATTRRHARTARGRRRQLTPHLPTRAAATTRAIPAAANPTGPTAGHGSRSRAGQAAHGAGNALEAIGRHIPLPLPVPDWSKPIILALLLLAIALGLRARLAGLRARRLERQRVTLMRDLDAMQAALVPDVPAQIGGLAVSVAYRPAEGPAAGGDFYDVFAPHAGKVAVILGDVAGHGHEALTQAALTRYTLRAYMQAGMEPRAALALAGSVLADPALASFATVIVGVYDRHHGTLSYACAGHPYPILHGLPAREPLAIYSSPPIGWCVPTGRRQTTLSLPAGAAVCFFSDGLIEARCRDELLGVDRLSQLVAALGREPDATRLLEQVRATATATPDDMAACILTPSVLTPSSATAAGHVHIEEVEADMRSLNAAGLRRFLESCQISSSEIGHAIARAHAIAARFGTAVLRIELTPTSATAAVSPPVKPPAATAPRNRSPAAGRSPLQVLTAT
jgi:Stage II sporulation protein E (SpoIIE)